MAITKELMEFILYTAGFMGLICAIVIFHPLLKHLDKGEPCQKVKPKRWK